MNVFGDRDEPCLKIVRLIKGMDLFEGFGKGDHGNFFSIVFVFMVCQMIIVNIVPEAIEQKTKSFFLAFFCQGNIFFDRVFCRFQ